MAFRVLHVLAPIGYTLISWFVLPTCLVATVCVHQHQSSYRLHVPAHRLVSAGRRMFPVVNAAIPCSLAGGLPSSVSGTILLAGACRPLAYTEHVSETLYHLTSITVCLSTTEDIPIS